MKNKIADEVRLSHILDSINDGRVKSGFIAKISDLQYFIIF